MSGPFARRRQARRNARDLGTGLWRRCHDRFARSLDRYWQVIQEPGARVCPEELNGLVNAGNVLADLLPRVRSLCVAARGRFAEHELDIPAEAGEVHRTLSRAANDLATTAQAAAMFRLQQGSLDSVSRRAEKVIVGVREAEEQAAAWPAERPDDG